MPTPQVSPSAEPLASSGTQPAADNGGQTEGNAAELRPLNGAGKEPMGAEDESAVAPEAQAEQQAIQEEQQAQILRDAAIQQMTAEASQPLGLCGGCGQGAWQSIKASLRNLANTLLDTIAHFVVFMTLAHGTWLSLIVVATAASSTVFYALYDGGSMAAKLDWQFVSFSLVFPVTFFLAETWRRRERGLSKMAGIKSLSLWIYLAHRDWLHQDKLPADHLVKVKSVIVKMLCDLHAYITLRRLTTRDLYFAVGKNTRFVEFEKKRRTWRREMYVQMKLLSRLTETLKDLGLPTNEASRLNQYHSLFLRDVEEVMNIKDYRTPQGIRSFTRVYVILIWVMFGAYYAWVAQETGSLVFAVALAMTAAMALAGLIKVSMTMEDPFESIGVDDVRTSRDLAEVIFAIKDDELQDTLNFLETGVEGRTSEDNTEDVKKFTKGLAPVFSVHKKERWQSGNYDPLRPVLSPIGSPGKRPKSHDPGQASSAPSALKI